MATYEFDTKLKPEEVLQRADVFFGEPGLGLTRRVDAPVDRAWEGGGGAVFLKLQELEKGTRVEIGTTEWDAPVREFIGLVPK